MRILFVSDIHVKIPYPVLSRILEEEKYDIALSGGDWDLSVPLDIPTVYGNHDLDVEFREKLIDGFNVVKKNRVISHSPEDMDKGVTVCAFGGAVIRDNYGYSETWHTPEYYMKKYLELKKLAPFRCDIMITHDSPQSVIKTEKQFIGNNTEYDPKFYRSLFDLIAGLLQPKLYLSGHVHSTLVTISKIKTFDVYNSSKPVPVVKHVSLGEGYVIVDLDNNSVELKSFFDDTGVSLPLNEESVVTRDWEVLTPSI